MGCAQQLSNYFFGKPSWGTTGRRLRTAQHMNRATLMMMRAVARLKMIQGMSLTCMPLSVDPRFVVRAGELRL